MIKSWMLPLTLAMSLAGLAAIADTPGPGPQEIVENSAKKMLAELDANRATYAKSPAKLDELVSTVLLPTFDSEYAARLVLGLPWRNATPEQRKRFVDAFYHSRLRQLRRLALVDFHGRLCSRSCRIGASPTDKDATVRTEVQARQWRQGAGEFHFAACNGHRLEGLGCRDRGRVLRQEFPHGHWRRGAAEGPG